VGIEDKTWVQPTLNTVLQPQKGVLGALGMAGFPAVRIDEKFGKNPEETWQRRRKILSP
jgi:hypothetical protein